MASNVAEQAFCWITQSAHGFDVGKSIVAIQIQEPQVQVLDIKFRAHVRESHRFLDVAGAFITKVRNDRPEWNLIKGTPNQSIFQHHKDPITVNAGSQDFALACSLTEARPIVSAGVLVEKFALAIDYFYSLFTEVVQSPRTDRLGVYFAFAFPASNVEEADRFVTKVVACPFASAVASTTKAEFYDGAGNYFVGDSSSSIRRAFQVMSIVRNQPPGANPPMGFPIPDTDGAVLVTVDTFTRPDDGHLSKLVMFVQEQYAASKAYSLEVMRALASR